MHWFAPSERGLALGIRQANVPLGGLVAALALPPLADNAGLGWAFAALAGTCLAAALAGAVLLREPTAVTVEAHAPAPSKPLRDPALWRISSGSGLIVVGQIATMSFTVLYLSEGRGFSTRDAALVYAAAQVVGGALRILLGHVSDRFGSRIVPLCRAALAVSGTLALVAPSPVCRTGPRPHACSGRRDRPVMEWPVVRRRGRDRRRPGERRRDRAPANHARVAGILAPIGFATSSRKGRGGSRSWSRPCSPWPAGQSSTRSQHRAGLAFRLLWPRPRLWTGPGWTRSRARATRRAARRRSSRPTSCKQSRAAPRGRRSPRR